MISRDDWLTALKDAEEQLPESDALTVKEFADLIGMERNSAQARLLLLVKAGKAHRTTKQIRRSDNRIMTTTAYRLVNP